MYWMLLFYHDRLWVYSNPHSSLFLGVEPPFFFPLIVKDSFYEIYIISIFPALNHVMGKVQNKNYILAVEKHSFRLNTNQQNQNFELVRSLILFKHG